MLHQVIGILENQHCTGIFELSLRYSSAEHPDAYDVRASTRFGVPYRVADEDSPVGGYSRTLQCDLDDVGLRLGGVHIGGRGDFGDKVVTVENLSQ